MRTFEQLTPEQQAQAEEKTLQALLAAICAGTVRFKDSLNGDDLQARIDRAGEEMERMRTPWFLAERIMEDAFCAERLRGMARCDAEDAIYLEAHERTVEGIA